MEIHQLEYVVAVDRYKHFSLAAEQINVSQPTLSHQIKKLEIELGVELFIRTTRSIQVTAAGKTFIEYAKRILRDIEQAKFAMAEYVNVNFGTIRIGAVPNMTSLGITSLVIQFKKEFPNINMTLYEDNSESLLKKVKNHEIDVAFINTSTSIEEVDEYYPLIQDQFILFLSKQHARSSYKQIDLASLSQEKFILFKMGPALRNQFVTLCKEAGFTPNIIFESSHMDTMKGLVEEGLGILLSSRIAASSMLSDQTAIVELKPTMNRYTGLVISQNSHLLCTKTFRDFILLHQKQLHELI